MNAIFVVIALAAIILISIISPESLIGVMLDGAMNAIDLSLKLLCIYAVWMSVLRMLETSGINNKLTRLFTPVTDKLFKNESEEAKKYITVNMASNMLGLGGAATPAGIKAIECMDTGSDSASKNMVMFIVINATSIQLLPATIMALMSTHGSESPSAIILPSIIATAISTTVGILLVSLKKK